VTKLATFKEPKPEARLKPVEVLQQDKTPTVPVEPVQSGVPGVQGIALFPAPVRRLWKMHEAV
jgi:hypothetical protein